MQEMGNAVPDTANRAREGEEKGLPKSLLMVKVAQTLKTGTVVETCLPAGADAQINGILKGENQTLSGGDTSEKFLHHDE